MMSKLRSINTRIWSDNWFEELNPTSKLLFIYLITNEANNMLGVYEVSIRKMSFETGIDKANIEKALKDFERVNKVLYIDGYVCLNNFIKHQSYNINMKKSAIEIYNSLPSRLKTDKIEYIHIPNKSDDVNAYNQQVNKGFQSLCEGFGMLRKDEVEDESESEVESEEKSKTWRNDFETYKQTIKDAYIEIQNDKEYLSKCQEYNNKLDILKSIEKSIIAFWGTKEGWANKKKYKDTVTIDWKSTFFKNIEKNKVYL